MYIATTYSDVVSTIALIVTVIGIGGAVWAILLGKEQLKLGVVQLERTADASEATRDAIQRTEKRMALNHLLVLLPQFQMIEIQLDTAVEENNGRLARQSLLMYTTIASQVAAILEKQDPVNDNLVEQLRQAAEAASHAKSDLVSKRNADVNGSTGDFRKSLSSMSATIAGVVGSYQFSVEAT